MCLYGDHQDYLGLPVIAAAIDRSIRLEAKTISSPYLNIDMPDIGLTRQIKLNQELSHLPSRDYLLSGLKVASENGCQFETGLDIKMTGNLPINAGASSSSAMVVAWLQLLFEMYSPDSIEKKQLADLAFQAEITEHNEPGGFMDHYASAIGGLLFIENNKKVTYEKLSNKMSGLLLANSRLSKKTIYVLAVNKARTTKAIKILKSLISDYDISKRTVEHLDDDLKLLPDDLWNPYEAALVNHQITLKAKQLFDSGENDSEQLADLMNRHHDQLKNNLNLTVPKIDQMIDTAKKNGALACKINGSGLGGTIVILAPENQAKIMKSIQEMDADCYPVEVSRGAEISYE